MTPDIAGYRRFRRRFAETINKKGMVLLDGMVESRAAQTWIGEAGAIVTNIKHDGKSLYLNTLMVGGDQAEIIEILRPKAEAWAREIGLTYSFLEGRPGWRRVLGKHGYTPFNDGLRKDL